jgi:hypothetical protein
MVKWLWIFKCGWIGRVMDMGAGAVWTKYYHSNDYQSARFIPTQTEQ